MPILQPIRERRTNEELFFEHYSQILGWASQLVHSDRADAEDLVQEFYIHVTRSNAALADVDEIQPYLFKVLRNLHYSRLRQEGRSPIYDLSIVDYDSVEWGLAAVDRRGLFLVRANLKIICEFVCQRKNTSRASSIFILRFFMGYFPSEVMKVAQLTRVGVDKSLQFVRREAQLYLEKPDATRSTVPQGRPDALSSKATDDSHALFLELRQTVFGSCEGPCFPLSALEKRYREASPTRFTTRELAHLVSCKNCLDRANRILGLPLLDERSPDDTIGRDNPPGFGGVDAPKLSLSSGTKRTAGPKERKALDRKARGVFEHRPESLEISVNGETRTSQRVTAEVSEFHLKLGRTEAPEFIEVFSEQRVRLVYLHVTEPTLYPSLEQREHIVFSDDRSLELTLSFGNDLPTVHVVYRDPILEKAVLFDDEEEFDLSESSAMALVEAEDSVKPKSVVRSAVRGIARLAKGFKRFFVDMMSPMLATALVCGVAAIVLFTLSLRGHSLMKADELLQRATVAENAAVRSDVTGVVVQSVRIQTTQFKAERTLYRDVQRKRRLKDKTLSQHDASLRTELENSGIAWNDPLSAGSFRAWHDGAVVQQDMVNRPEKGLLTLTTTVSAGRIASESLTVRETDFHPVKRTVELRDAGTIEVAELNYSVLPWSSVNPDLFEPISNVGTALGGNTHPAILPHLPRGISAEEMDIAELSARLVLNRLGFDDSGRIEIRRDVDGVHIQGIVDTETQKSQLRAQLLLVPHVLPSILTVQEMADNPTPISPDTTIHQSSDDAQAPSSLERYFVEHGLDHKELSPAAQEFVEGSFVVKHETEQVASLLQRFSTNTTLPNQARTALGELLVQHRTALLTALGREERALMVSKLIATPSGAAAITADNPQSLRKDADENFALCVELTSDTTTTTRPAQIIAPQLEESIAVLRAAALQISTTTLPHPLPPGNAGLAKKN